MSVPKVTHHQKAGSEIGKLPVHTAQATSNHFRGLSARNESKKRETEYLNFTDEYLSDQN